MVGNLKILMRMSVAVLCAMVCFLSVSCMGGGGTGTPYTGGNNNSYSNADTLVNKISSIRLNNTFDYMVAALTIGKSSRNGSYIYGVARIQYRGSGFRTFVYAKVTYRNRSNLVLFTDSGYVYNTVSTGLSSGINTATWLSGNSSTGYYYIIGDLGSIGASVDDIYEVSFNITDVSTSAQTTAGAGVSVIASATDSAYGYAWFAGIRNNSSTGVSVTGRMIFSDNQGLQFKWTFPGLQRLYAATYEDVLNEILGAGETGRFKATMPTPDYYTTPLDLAVTSIDWDPVGGSITKQLAGCVLSEDQMNEKQRGAMHVREERNRQSETDAVMRVK